MFNDIHARDLVSLENVVVLGSAG